MYITFLGTASGGGPSQSRNCSSLVCNFGVYDGPLWMVDCAEGTNRQFQFQPYGQQHVKAYKVEKIFITHMHADHIMGIVPFLRNILVGPVAGAPLATYAARKQPRIEIFGPSGIRSFVRQILKMTITRTRDFYVVHELLTNNDPSTPCDLPDDLSSTDMHTQQQNIMHVCEAVGRDIRPNEEGLWKDLTVADGPLGNIAAHAAPIQHRDPCIGYVFEEESPASRKLVILGDTYDPSQIIPLCLNPSPSLLIHEATDAHIPRHADPTGKLSRRTKDEVRKVALARGHSVPDMAGAFAKRVGAERLVLNHIGGRFPMPSDAHDSRVSIIREIEKQATIAWGAPGKQAIAAYDFLQVSVPQPYIDIPDPESIMVDDIPASAAVDIDAFTRSVDWQASGSAGKREWGHVETEVFSVKHTGPSKGGHHGDRKRRK